MVFILPNFQVIRSIGFFEAASNNGGGFFCMGCGGDFVTAKGVKKRRGGGETFTAKGAKSVLRER